jgi:hypothetical protein
VHHPQAGVIDYGPCTVLDLVSGGRSTWTGPRHSVELSPHTLPAHVFKVTEGLKSKA